MMTKWQRLVCNSRFLYFFFGKYGFVRWGFHTFVVRLWWRIKNGFWVTDLYGTDVVLARLLAPRLYQLAITREGCPSYYGLTEIEIAEEQDNPGTHSPKWDKWTIDLLKASEAAERFLFLESYVPKDDYGDNDELRIHMARYHFEEEKKAMEEFKKALHWVADNVGGLWV